MLPANRKQVAVILLKNPPQPRRVFSAQNLNTEGSTASLFAAVAEANHFLAQRFSIFQ